MSIEALVEAIDELIAEDAVAHCDAASVKCLVRQLTRLESVTTKAVAAFDSSGDWSIDGAKTAAAWVSTVCRLPRAMGRRLVRRGRHLRHLPVVAQAFEEGELTSAHLDALASVRREGNEEVLARDEPMLVKRARRLRFEQFTRAVAYWDQLADPDGSEEAAMERRARRDVYLEASISGRIQPVSATTSANFSDGVI